MEGRTVNYINAGAGAGAGAVVEFESFFELWILQQQRLLQELIQLTTASNCDSGDENRARLIGRVLLHFADYYEAKSRVAHANVFLLFCPTWFTSFERTFLWIAGFKPSIVFKLATKSVRDLSHDQSGKLDRLTQEVKTEEQELAMDLSHLQSSAATSTSMVDLARRWTRSVVNGEVVEEEAAVERLGRCVESVVQRADILRGNTVIGVLDILTSAQGVKFLMAMLQFQVTVRAWGRRREEASSTPFTSTASHSTTPP